MFKADDRAAVTLRQGSFFPSFFRYLQPHTIVKEIIMSPDFGPGEAVARGEARIFGSVRGSAG
jgi:hypothetical protein